MENVLKQQVLDLQADRMSTHFSGSFAAPLVLTLNSTRKNSLFKPAYEICGLELHTFGKCPNFRAGWDSLRSAGTAFKATATSGIHGEHEESELVSTRAPACPDRRLAGRIEHITQSQNGNLDGCANVVGEGADHRTRGRVRSPLQRNSSGLATFSSPAAPCRFPSVRSERRGLQGAGSTMLAPGCPESQGRKTEAAPPAIVRR